MARDLLSRYLWLIDLIKRYGRVSRAEINEQWKKSRLGNGEDMPRRTFYNYREAIAELFNIEIQCDASTYEYYIDEGTAQQESVTAWLLDSTATNNMITSSRDIADKVFLENVPSARQHLPTVMESLRGNISLLFDYHPYSRSRATKDVELEPYFTKIFKQRWYVVGRNVQDEKIKTYALDRITDIKLTGRKFKTPADFCAADYFKHAFGIIVDQGEVKTIRLSANSTQAKYFRALPLHPSQQEYAHDQYSIFEYRMRITPDLVNELLSYGSRITILGPAELKAAITTELRKSLSNYE
ncbi:MAG: WYL domain-containing protein [Clostridium sp.]|nr:WYL domain-containing protein [Clostridium sp.]